MRLLLDTHILLWVLEGHPSLSAQARGLIQDTANEVFVSSASLFEIAIKTRIGKLHTQRTTSDISEEMTQVLAIQLLPHPSLSPGRLPDIAIVRGSPRPLRSIAVSHGPG